MTSAIITALGAVTSVGMDAVTTCASIRAGLSRPASLAEYEVLDRDQHAPTGLTAHPVAGITLGFSGVGRWLQLAALAIQDLCRSAQLPGIGDRSFWSSTAFHVVAPVIDADRFALEPACASEEELVTSFAAPLLARMVGCFTPARTKLCSDGRTGALKAALQAEEDFQRGQYTRAVVLAVDSMLDPPSLQWLAERGRLKEDENPVGVTPGEGAVCFMLESPRTARQRRAMPLGRIVAAVDREPRAYIAGERSIGEALARAVDGVLKSGRVSLPYEVEAIVDLNGEPWRAEEYGHARIRVRPDRWASELLVLPAVSVGDIGAGMTALQIVLACRSLTRGYASAEHVLITSSDEYGNVGAAVLQKAE